MKTIFGIMLILITMTTISCEKDTVAPTPTSITPTLIGGTWRHQNATLNDWEKINFYGGDTCSVFIVGSVGTGYIKYQYTVASDTLTIDGVAYTYRLFIENSTDMLIIGGYAYNRDLK